MPSDPLTRAARAELRRLALSNPLEQTQSIVGWEVLALLDALDAAEAEAARLRSALDVFHCPWCGDANPTACTGCHQVGCRDCLIDHHWRDGDCGVLGTPEEIARLRAALGRLETWAREYGVALLPPAPWTDCYGDGTLHAKLDVAAILAATR